MQSFQFDSQFIISLAIAGPFVVLFIIFFVAFLSVRTKYTTACRRIVWLEHEADSSKLNLQVMEQEKVEHQIRDAKRDAQLKGHLYRIELLTTVLGIVRPYTRLIYRDDKKLEAYIKQLRAPKKKAKPVKHLEIDKTPML